MSDRLCGYCRAPNHTTKHCLVRKDQIRFILNHTALTRKHIADYMLKSGVGIGAIVTTVDYWSGEEFPIVIPSYEFIGQIQPVNYRHVKYSKRVVVNLTSYGVTQEIPPHLKDLVRYTHKSYVDAYGYKMDDMGQTCFAAVGTTENFRVAPYEYRKAAKILSPSEDTDPDTSYMSMGVRIHKRLTLNKDSSNMLTPYLP